MSINVYMKSRNGTYDVTGMYGEHFFVVHGGGKINLAFAGHVKGGKKAKAYRNNPQYVSSEGYIIHECTFSSPSNAALFVTGRSCNGYEAWKVAPRKSLKQYLEENNMR